MIKTQEVWYTLNGELFLFILKRVKDKDSAGDVFQNTFLKIHKNLSKLKKKEKVRAWAFQIARNEINNHFNKSPLPSREQDIPNEVIEETYQHICCFDKFILELPETQRNVIELVYINGKKQREAAKTLKISLENVKTRISRAKETLKTKFNKCCGYQFDRSGKLVGESNCSTC
ncbi:MAG: sigma-70 family RNA polymerase sigma factor [Cyclobacteriaceae bacterium]